MNFKEFKAKFQANFPSNSTRLYVLDVPKDMLWDTFITSFAPELQAEYTCNCCRSFIKNYGNLAQIIDGKLVSVWSMPGHGQLEEFTNVVQQMYMLTSMAEIRDVFFTETRKLGTDKNRAQTESGEVISWNHMFAELSAYAITPYETIPSAKSIARSTIQVFDRALREISVSTVETVLELIDQGSIYRGTEFRGQLEAYLRYKRTYDGIPGEIERKNYPWANAHLAGGAITNIRSGAIGTLLQDVSEGVDLDIAIRKFESVMAPANYKRPTAILTKKQIEDAEKTIDELGFRESLGRKFAINEDLPVSEILFVNREKEEDSIFTSLKEEVPVNPKTLLKVEEITVGNFLEKILPKSTSIELLLEGQHTNNFVSIIAPKVPSAPSMFKWDNGFSWSYRNAIADSGMKERVKNAGGNVTGVLRFSIQWNDEDTPYQRDMDAHAHEPGITGAHIYFSSFRGPNNRSPMTGNLDVDRTGGTDIMVENITWLDKSKMKDGDYKLSITNFSGQSNKGIKAEVEMDGELHQFHYKKNFLGSINIAVVTLKNGVFSIASNLESNSGVTSREVWGVKTAFFQKINMITKSPNYWGDNATGNEHLFFIIDKAKNDEEVRGFFNEFLKEDLMIHKRVFEALGSKMKVAYSEDQLSGLGFSSTKKDEVIVRVTGSFSRVLKIKF